MSIVNITYNQDDFILPIMLSEVNDFSKWLIQEMTFREWSQADLARQSGISKGMISHLVSGTREPGAETCKALARSLRMPEEEVFRAAGILTRKTTNKDGFEEWIYLLNQLPEQDRAELMAIARLKLDRQERMEKKQARFIPGKA